MQTATSPVFTRVMMWVPGCFLLLVTTHVHISLAKEAKGHVSVVVLGATGDLARKYVWQGFFQLFAEQVSSRHSFSFYGGGTSHYQKAQPALFEILKGLACPSGLHEQRCALVKEQFLKVTQYRQLNSSEDYVQLAQDMEHQVAQEGLQEAGRLFYLSIPPFAYANVTRNINSSCRPPAGVWLRVVLEKPFGHNLESCQLLVAELHKVLKEEEVYKVDHYLGNQVVAQILPFRKKNRKVLEPLWNKRHIERVEIVLKETLDVKGRIKFYEQYGVIRDVLQNHLTEILALVAMRVPANLSSSLELLHNKLRAFKDLRPLESSSAVVGQYEGYKEEVQAELNKEKHHTSLTPTYAGVVTFIDNGQFDGVPIFITSGKKLDERTTYARIVFKKEVFCVQNTDALHCKPRQIVFHLGHGSLEHPAILVSKNLFRPALLEGWIEMTEHEGSLFGLSLSDYHVQAPVVQTDAYSTLISQVFHGRKDQFISTETLLASWAFWTTLLDGLKNQVPRTYPGSAQNENILDFQLQDHDIAFTSEAVVLSSQRENFQVMQGKYRSSDMVSAWVEELIQHLAADLEAAAIEAVREGGQFHLALSGGSSPLALFQRLAMHHFSFPWRQTHVWMVDERCVPLSEPGSNFHTVYSQLLQHVPLPYFNAHPMPVQMNQRLCVEEDGGPQTYQKDIAQLVNDSSFHFVLLGVGYDGHTASLFPGAQLDTHTDKLVSLTESPAKPHQRMSLTLPAINRARMVAVLVTGKGKHEIVTQLSRVKENPKQYPITGVNPTQGRLVWYIDYDAVLG